MIQTQFFTGGLVDDPETNTTQSGRMVTNFRIGESDSKPDGQGGWETMNRLYLRAVCWDSDRKPLAQIAAQLRKGDQVAIVGKLTTRQYTSREGESKTTTEVNVFDIYSKLTANPPQQGSGQQSSGGGWNSQQQAPPQPSTGGFGGGQGNWGQPAPTGQQAMDENPPF